MENGDYALSKMCCFVLKPIQRFSCLRLDNVKCIITRFRTEHISEQLC